MAHKKIRDPRTMKRVRRKFGIRRRLRGSAQRPRLTVFRSSKHIYVQAIDDDQNKVIASASDRQPAVKAECDGKKKAERARVVGAHIAKKLLEQKIETAVFDRNGFIYHGRVKELADGAREGGLKF